MGLTGKLTAQIEYRSGGDVFHEVFRFRPHHISGMSDLIKGCVLHEGEWGQVGSKTFWKYIHDGKEEVVTHVLEAVDEEKRSITLDAVDGDLKQLYKTFKTIFHVETNGDIDLVTVTFQYEKLNDDVEEPLTLLGFLLNVTRDIEAHHLKE